MPNKRARSEIETIFNMIVDQKMKQSENYIVVTFDEVYNRVSYAYSTVLNYFRQTCGAHEGKYDPLEKKCVIYITEEKT
jgi:hypothetical protein